MSDFLTVEQLIENAPSDLEEREVEAFGGKVLVRGLSAHDASRVHQGNVKVVRGDPVVDIASVQIAKFLLGVVTPKLTEEQVRKLHRTSGTSFVKVVNVIDELSGNGEEEEKANAEDFREE